MAAAWPEFTLPCSPSYRCLDRFSILEDSDEDEDGLVQFWHLLQRLLKQPVTNSSQLIDILETISITLNGSSGAAGDYGTLKIVVEQLNHNDNFFSRLWPRIVQYALLMPHCFPDSSLKVLGPNMKIHHTEIQSASLLAHQFLCTLPAPAWRGGFNDFSIWYNLEQRHPKAVQTYLKALLFYFEQLGDRSDEVRVEEDISRQGTEYQLHTFKAPHILATEHWETVPLAEIEIVNLERYCTEQQELAHQGLNGAVVVPANKHIGFGQSATQEELYVANCPQSCPAVLFTPPLEDDQVLVIRGAAPMFRISGQRRDISWESLDVRERCGGRMLFMDALEVDNMDDGDGLPDLGAGNILRELRKSYTAFASWEGGREATISTGLWGCGAFNGNPGVKVTILWMAASLARKRLRVICDPSNAEFSAKFGQFIDQVPRFWKMQHLMESLLTMPRSLRLLETVDWLLKSFPGV